MSNGHVDEIQQGSIGAPLPKRSGFFEFVGDLDQMIYFCHRAVLLLVGLAASAPAVQRLLPAPPRETRLYVGHSISPDYGPRIHEQLL